MKNKHKKKVISTNRRTTKMYCFDKDIGFWGIPNINKEVNFGYNENDPIIAKHNSFGLREKKIEFNDKPSVLCCGGSHTWGSGIVQGKRYSDLLDTKNKFNVINMGHCSLGLDQILLAIMKHSKKFNAKIIIIEQYTWALHRVITKSVNGYIKPNFSLDENSKLNLNKIPLYYKNKAIREVIGSFYNFKKELNEFSSGIDLKKSYDLKTDPIFLSWKTGYYVPMYKLLDAIIQVLASYCRNQKIKLLFSLGPLKNQLDFKSNSKLIDYDMPHKKFIQLLEKNGVKYLNHIESVIQEHQKSPIIFPDGHPNEKGHLIISKNLTKELSRLNWI